MTENSHENAQSGAAHETADRDSTDRDVTDRDSTDRDTADRADGAADVSTSTPNETGEAAIPELVIIS
ncbi:RNase adaptor protein RapZ, partial [Streptomyces sp. SID7499]|nr:RNase adaptor protein RapZ [Streptomyces sp. SID7499]